jgi:hypothetical protein
MRHVSAKQWHGGESFTPRGYSRAWEKKQKNRLHRRIGKIVIQEWIDG